MSQLFAQSHVEKLNRRIKELEAQVAEALKKGSDTYAEGLEQVIATKDAELKVLTEKVEELESALAKAVASIPTTDSSGEIVHDEAERFGSLPKLDESRR